MATLSMQHCILLLLLCLLVSQVRGRALSSDNDATFLLPRMTTEEYACGGPYCERSPSGSSRLRPRGVIQHMWDVGFSSDPYTNANESAFDKRTFKWPTDLNGGLAKKLPEEGYVVGEIAQYIYRKLEFDGNNQYDSQSGGGIGLDDGTEAPVARYAKFGDRAFSLGTGGVYGCQVITVVSPEAVWMAHFWEVYTNGEAFNEGDDADTLQPSLSLTAWNERMLDMLTGKPEPTNPSQGAFPPGRPRPYIRRNGPGLTRDMFPEGVKNNGKQIRVYIGTPRDRGSTNLSYGKRFERIKSAMRAYLGSDITIQSLEYNRLPNGKNSPSTPQGQYLFQYDPNANPEADVAMADTDEQFNGRRQWRIFYEHKWEFGYVADNI